MVVKNEEEGDQDVKKWKYNRRERRVDELIGLKSEKKPALEREIGTLIE